MVKLCYLRPYLSTETTLFDRIIAFPRLIASVEWSPLFDGNILNNRLPRIIGPPPTTTGNPLSIPIAVNLEDEAEVESDPAKLISDDAEDIDNEN